MQVLFLGGTRFAGRHLVEALVQRGHSVTLFHRGQNEPAGLEGVEHVHGDRGTELDRLANRTFDAVVDTSGYTPDVVGRAVDFFAGSTSRYLFFSSISVYAEENTGKTDESAPRQTLPEGASTTEMVLETYGALKALCEDRVANGFEDRAVIVRPGLIVGPFDPTDRFTYWPVRFAEGGEVLTPGSAQRFTQFIDARDLAELCVRLLEEHASGAFNAVCAPRTITFGDVFTACAAASENGATPVWVDDEFLLRHDVQPWSELPLWIPGEDASFSNVDVSRAQAAGLRTRDVSATVRDTLQWARGMKRDEMKAGMKSARERELLAAWRQE